MNLDKYSRITKKHIDKAILEFDADPASVIPVNTKYFIENDGKKYPSKGILLKSYKIAYGTEPGSSFHGGKDNAHKFFLEKKWYRCIPDTLESGDSVKEDHVWIFPCDKRNYDADKAFRENGHVSWYKVSNSKNVKKGDIVYIYLSNKIKEVHWRCTVGEPNYYLAGLTAEDEKVRSLVKSRKFKEGPFIELIPEYEFTLHDMLTFKELQKHGLKSKIVSPQRLEAEVYKYICDVEVIDCDDNKRTEHIKNISLDTLKILAEKKSCKDVKSSITTSKTYYRNPYVSQYAKELANGICQLCERPAPFTDSSGEPYLETHHIKWLSRGGADSVENTSALCPNCHKKMHILDDENDIKKLLYKAKNNK